MSTTSTGRQAETVAANYLLRQGFEIIAHNWRNRWCEIDLIAQKSGVVHFVEVKYRRTTAWGSGIEYVTPAKLRQMQFAAEMWVHTHHWQGDYALGAIEVSGEDFVVTTFIEEF